MHRPIFTLVLAAALSASVAGCASRPPPPPPADSLPHAPILEEAGFPGFTVVSPGIALSGQPTHYTRIEEAQILGYATIVNLRTEDEGARFEEQTAEHYGIGYVQIPVEGADIRPEQADDFAVVLADPEAYPVLMHCGSGARAAGVWTLYLVRHRGYTAEQALDEVDGFGLLKPELREVLERRMSESR